MKQQIEQLVNQRDYTAALSQLTELHTDDVLSKWAITAKLRCFRALGKMAEAIELAHEVAKQDDDQTDSEQRRYAALVLAEGGSAEIACSIMSKECKASPNFAALHREYAYALIQNDQFDTAEQALSTALELKPGNANTHTQLARLLCRTGRVEQGLRHYFNAATIEPNNDEYLQRIVYWSNYSDQFSQQSNAQLAKLWASRKHPNSQKGGNTWRTANPDRKLNIGFVSGDFFAHAVSFFVRGLFEKLDRSRFVVHAYSDVKKEDAVTQQIKSSCDVWRSSADQKDSQLAAQISADQIDVLVDLSGHTGNNRLSVFAQQLAPIQLSWLGYPASTGLPSIGYRLSDEVVDIAELADKHYSEQLLTLKRCFVCYEPLDRAPSIRQKEESTTSVVIFGSFNNLAKISETTLDAWAKAMHAVPNSKLYLKRVQLKHSNTRQHFVDSMRNRGIGEERLILKTSKAKIEQHLDQYNEVDIALDTYPYNGTTTTLEALWMGTPVVTLAGSSHASRVGKSILHYLGHEQLIGNNIDEFVQKVAELSDNQNLRTRFQSTLRNDMQASGLTDFGDFASAFSSAILTQWAAWCSERNQAEGLAPIRKQAFGLEESDWQSDDLDITDYLLGNGTTNGEEAN